MDKKVSSSKGKISVKLIKSPIGAIPKHKDTLRGLGLRKMHQVVVLDDNPCIRGMINSISHLLLVEKG